MDNQEQQSLFDDGSNYWDDNQSENFEEWYEKYLYENSCDLGYEKRCDEMLGTPIDIQLLLLQSSAAHGISFGMEDDTGESASNVGGDDASQYCDPLSCEYLEMDMGEPDWGVFGENIPPSC